MGWREWTLIAGGPGLFRAAHDPLRRESVLSGVFWGLPLAVIPVLRDPPQAWLLWS